MWAFLPTPGQQCLKGLPELWVDVNWTSLDTGVYHLVSGLLGGPPLVASSSRPPPQNIQESLPVAAAAPTGRGRGEEASSAEWLTHLQRIGTLRAHKTQMLLASPRASDSGSLGPKNLHF